MNKNELLNAIDRANDLGSNIRLTINRGEIISTITMEHEKLWMLRVCVKNKLTENLENKKIGYKVCNYEYVK
ncbi:hypothetical protein SAMN05216454_1416 [Peptostreptococcus russellii]|uniref:Uncharacterized protein n=1 Tax=Peptostreptococcus russellii TaxID=215200 RepID=A0A1H8KRI7_9FIRM|nr:hypothetical protein [Peptostreptococcus russellii]SEN95519.1 hypothetical protein SAMN05216454_1416 [Peptostreptococcus russellii]